MAFVIMPWFPIIRKFKADRLRDKVEIQVHSSNQIARNIYENCGFIKTGTAKWNEEFDVMLLEL